MLSGLDILILFSLTILLIVGGYQFYFLPQRKPAKSSSSFRITYLDRIIPFKAGWVWVYSGLYYPVIISLVFTIKSFRHFSYTAFSFIILLIFQLFFFYLFPVKSPDEWRAFERGKSLSTKFLSFVHQFDSNLNCFPSMHVSVATLTAYHLKNNLADSLEIWSNVSFMFPLLIGLSTLFTKQHYLLDIPAGFFLGLVTFYIFLAMSF